MVGVSFTALAIYQLVSCSKHVDVPYRTEPSSSNTGHMSALVFIHPSLPIALSRNPLNLIFLLIFTTTRLQLKIPCHVRTKILFIATMNPLGIRAETSTIGHLWYPPSTVGRRTPVRKRFNVDFLTPFFVTRPPSHTVLAFRKREPNHSKNIAVQVLLLDRQV